MTTRTTTSQAFGLSGVQTFTEMDLELYLGHRAYSYSYAGAASCQNADSFLSGGRYKF